MHETHGTFAIFPSTSKDHEGQYSVMNDETGQVRHFPTVQQCRQYIGVEESPGPKWHAVPLDDSGKPLADAATVAAGDEQAAKEAARSWFHFIGVYRIKEIRITPQ